jgi:hypothetical protein
VTPSCSARSVIDFARPLSIWRQWCARTKAFVSPPAWYCALWLSLEGEAERGACLPFGCARLRHRVGTIEKEDSYFFVRLRADIDTAVNAISRFVPVYLAAFEVEPSALTAIGVLDREDTTTQDHRHPMERVVMPRGRLTRRQAQSAHERCPTTMQHFLDHGSFSPKSCTRFVR